MPFPGIPNPQEVGIPAPPAESTDLLRGALKPLVDPVDASLRAVTDYATLLLAANTVTNLTGARDWETLVEAHILDCVLAARYIPEEARVLFDWGSGGGLPGLVWAGIFPERQFHLCERNGKKAEFLQAAASELEYMHVDVHAAQGEEILRTLDPRADLIVARAVEPLPKFLRRLTRPAVPPIDLFLMAGPSWQRDWKEDADLRKQWEMLDTNAYLLAPERGQRFTLHLRRKKA